MGSSKGGGGVDSGPMLEYGNKALDLQKQIYEEGKTANQPYQTAGVSGLNELMMRLGLGTGSATGTRTEAQIRQDLMPSYTSQAQSPASNYYISPDGRLVDVNDKMSFYREGADFKTNGMYTTRELAAASPADRAKAFSQMGYKAYSSAPAATVDNSGLDAAVQRALAQQQASATEAQQNPLYGSLLQSFGMDQYQADPGYQFRLSEGNKAIERGLSASGQYMTPERQKALAEYGQGMASQEYGNAYNRYNQDQGNIYNRLAGIAGIGQTSTAQQQQAGQQYGAQAGELYTGMGNAITSANVANQANKGSMFNTLLSAGSQIGSAYLMSDERLKENMEPYGIENGYQTYIGNYIDDETKTKYIMVKAQEVQETTPQAVIELDDGTLAVDYGLIGVEFRKAE